MTSSPEPVASWTPPDLDTPYPGRPRADRAAAGTALSADGDGAVVHAPEPAAWSLPDLDTSLARATRAEPLRSPEDEAHAVGFADGLQQGEARAGEQFRPVLEALCKVMEQVEASRARFEHDRERNLRGLALAVAHHLLQREVSADPTVVRDLVAKALELMPANAALEVRMNPADLAALAPETEKLAGSGRVISIQWIADAALQRGGFVVENPLRLVDGRADAALRTLFERLEHD